MRGVGCGWGRATRGCEEAAIVYVDGRYLLRSINSVALLSYMQTFFFGSFCSPRFLGPKHKTSTADVRAVLIEQTFYLPNFPFFFLQEKREKQETFPKFGNLTEEGKNVWKASHSNTPYLEEKEWEIWKYKKLCEKNTWKFRQKVFR